MGDGSRLVKTIQTITSRRAVNGDFVMGTVIKLNPLIIQVGTMNLSESFLMLSPFCVETKINLNHSHQASGSTKSTNLGSHLHSVTINSSNYATSEADLGSHSHEIEIQSENGLGVITLWRGLKVGDNVLMLKGANGQKYYVLQRQEGLGN